MHSNDVQSQLKTIAAEIFQLPLEEITDDLSVGMIEAWDSFGHLQLFMAIEEKLGVKFSTDEIIKLASLKDIAATIVSKTG
jgi:acyl carrier protein